MAILAITALPLVTSAQKQVKQILFNTKSYDIYGDNDHEYVTVLYTDCTYGRVPISDVKISGLDTTQLGLKNFTVEYAGVKSQCRALLINKDFYAVNESEFAEIKKLYGLTGKDKYNSDIAWITKYDSVLVEAFPQKFYLGDDNDISFRQTRYGYNGFNDLAVVSHKVCFDKPGLQKYTFSCYGQTISTDVNVIGVSSISDLPTIIYPYDYYTYPSQKVTVYYTDGKQKTIDFSKAKIEGLSPDKGGQQNIAVTIGDKTEHITVEVPAVESIHYTNMSLHRGSNMEDERLSLKYSNGVHKDVPINKAQISGLDTHKPGKQSVTIKFAGKQITTDVEVVDIDSVYISCYSRYYYENRPKPAKYISELPMNCAIWSFRVLFADGSSKNVNASDAKFTGLDTSTPGDKDVIVEYAGKTLHTTVNVFKVPEKFDFSEIDGTIRQFSYPEGYIKAIYNDNTSENIRLLDTYHNFDPTKLGSQKIPVDWHGYEDTLSITVVPNTMKPTKLDLSDVSTDILEYAKLTGNVKALYSDGTYDIFDVKFADFTLDSKTPGKKKIKVSFHGCTAPFTVTVKADPYKPERRDGIYYIETEEALRWYFRAAFGSDCILTNKIFTNKMPELKDVVTSSDVISSFYVSATIQGFTKSEGSRNGRFSAAQIHLISSLPDGGVIYIEDIYITTSKGERLSLPAIKLTK